MDAIDQKILNLLNLNARITNSEIGKNIDMTSAGVAERIKKMERNDLITSYETRINHRCAGVDFTTLILVSSDEKVGETAVGHKLAELDEVQEVHYLTGEFCYLIKVRVKDSDKLTEFLIKVGKIPNIRDTRAMVVLDTIKESLKLKI
ncbi:MAG: Lrp/AsnC family transcriptional regulator [Lentisphaerae bacterium]|nr:Lrp/AsnC family transcriptional regulator [Lentisphaerota bacterium]MCP4102451.1 Lrp/AsnC family transcriptional regulator [Lentisphaerota bacterium]